MSLWPVCGPALARLFVGLPTKVKIATIEGSEW